MMTNWEITVARHEERIKAIEDDQQEQKKMLNELGVELKSLKNWIMTLLGGMVLSLVLLVLNLTAGR